MIEARQTTIVDIEGAMSNGSEIHVVGWQPLGEFTGEVHPVADMFPMMADEELDDLAADITKNGLLHPIVLDDQGRLIDGRKHQPSAARAPDAERHVVFPGQDVTARQQDQGG